MSDVAKLIVLITHPNINPNLITDRLGYTPSLLHKCGEQVVTPKGERIDSYYGASKWQCTWDCEINEDCKKQLDTILKGIQKCSDFFKQIVSEGGTIDIYFMATNYSHIAFMLEPSLLEKMAKLNVSFGFEFFVDTLG